MTLMNVLEKAPNQDAQDRALIQEGLETVVLLLAPITPHICHVLWGQLGHAEAVIDARWPSVDESALVQDTLQLVVQVNGKLRGHIDVAASASREDVEAAARPARTCCAFHRRPEHPQGHRGTRQTGQHRRQLIRDSIGRPGHPGR